MVKSVAVIGAGVAGLTTVKTALDYGLQPTCFEQRADIGGLWDRVDPREDVVKRAAGMYKGLLQNSVKTWFAYSDFPQKEESPLLAPCEKAKEYLDDYADAFQLRPHIKLRTQVVEVKRGEKYDKDGKWLVSTRPTGTDKSVVTEEFDAVIVCSGYYSKQTWPDLPGKENFHGSIIHSGDFYSCDEYDGKTVAIVGAGISGCDIASLLAPRAAKVKLVTRFGVHIIPMWLSPGRSLEWLLFDRTFNETATPEAGDLRKMGEKWNGIFAEKFDFGSLGLYPSKAVFTGSVAVSADIDTWIYSGKVQAVRGGVEQVTERGLKLTGTGEEVDADAIICATGYSFQLPFLNDPDILPANLGDMDWWHYFYPVHQKHSTFFSVGLQYQFGPYPSLCEMQARAACGVISGELSLPPMEEMMQRIKKEKADQIAVKGRFPGAVNAAQYMMEVSKWLGCFPDIDAIARESVSLAWKCENGPFIPASFRLLGPHAKFHLAKKVIMDLKDPRP